MKSRVIPWPILIYFFIAVALVFVHVKLSPYAFDDAFIHFRVARNQLDSGAPYFNVGDPLKVSSSSGWVIVLTGLLAATRWLGYESNFPIIVSIFNALTLFGGMWIFVWIIETLLKKRLSLIERLIFQVQFIGVLLLTSWGLMETGLAIFIAGCGILLLLRSKAIGIALSALAVSFRLELIMPFILILGWLFFQRKTQPFLPIAYALVGFVPVALYDVYFYGSMVPQAAIAKPVVYEITSFISIFDVLFYSLPKLSISNVSILLVLGLALFAYLLLVVYNGFRERATDFGAFALIFSLWALLVAGSYVAGHVLIFDWYRPLYMVPLITAGAILLYGLDRPLNGPRVLFFLITIICAITIARTFAASLISPAILSDEFEAGSRVRRYQQVGSTLYMYFPAARLLSSEIGGLGYTFKGQIIDAVGLASPEALEFHPLKVPEQKPSPSSGGIPPAFVQAIMPEIIVSYDVFAQALLSDEVAELYEQVQVSPYLPEDAAAADSETLWGSRFLRIYIRKDLPIPDEILALGK